MVMDLQDVKSTLEDAVAKSQIRLFDSSLKPLDVQAGPSRLSDMSDEGDDEESDIESESHYGSLTGSGLDDDSGSDDWSQGDEDEPGENGDGSGDWGRSSHRNIHRSIQDLPLQSRQRREIEYADSDSDLEGDVDSAWRVWGPV